MYRLDSTMSSAQPLPEARFAGVSVTNAAVMELGEWWWVKEVWRGMEADAEELGAVAKVLDVPRLLLARKPEAYTPQHFALGPYHHQRTKLRDMERYKLGADKRAEKQFAGNRAFEDLVHKFAVMKDIIRAPYHRYRPALLRLFSLFIYLYILFHLPCLHFLLQDLPLSCKNLLVFIPYLFNFT